MADTKLIENLKELKKFYEENEGVFNELTGGLKLLFDNLTTESPETVADGFEYIIDLSRAEQLLDEDLALRRQGAEIITKTISIIKDLIKQKFI